jgi:4'-phosphopantetheinyl transferase
MEKNNKFEWLSPPERLKAEENSVHVWLVYLPGERPRLTFFMKTLSSDEQARAARFLRTEDRVSFTIGRGILRCVLSKYLGSAPENIRFDYTSFGKPRLRINPELPLLNFNVSHSNCWAVIAIGKNRKIGIDVEYIRADLDVLGISRRFFSPQEADLIGSAPEEKRQRLFYEIWVRKEAYVKATGKGLSMPLSRFAVPLGSHTPVILYDEDPWLFHSISIDPDYASALVTHPPVTCIRKYDWHVAVASR